MITEWSKEEKENAKEKTNRIDREREVKLGRKQNGSKVVLAVQLAERCTIADPSSNPGDERIVFVAKV